MEEDWQGDQRVRNVRTVVRHHCEARQPAARRRVFRLPGSPSRMCRRSTGTPRAPKAAPPPPLVDCQSQPVPRIGASAWLRSLRLAHEPQNATELGNRPRCVRTWGDGEHKKVGRMGRHHKHKRPFRHGGRLPCACEPCTAWTLARYGAVRQWCSEACRHRMAECAAKLG